MTPKSNTLFHFTKSLDTLKLILENGFWPRYCLEDVRWQGYKNDYIAFPMVCFCDIPLSRISEHIESYGDFGIGLTRRWAEANGLNPILYVAGSSNNIALSFREINEEFNKYPAKSDRDAAKVSVRYLMAHSKPVEGTMFIDKKREPKLFYQESEWRYVPKHNEIQAYLHKSNFEDSSKLDIENALTKKHCMLKFRLQDIRYIFVKSDADIPHIVNFIQTQLDGHSGSDLKVLVTRVVSLESLSEDL